MAFFRQVCTLTVKNIRLALFRRPFSTVFRAFVLPVIFSVVLSAFQFIYSPPAYYGISRPSVVKSVPDAMREAAGGRNTLVFVNNGFVGGDIDRVIASVAAPVRAIGKTVTILDNPDVLLETCPSTLRGDSVCYAAVVFHSSPNEGPGGKWNYTLRADGIFGVRVDTRKPTDAELYLLPLQHAVDFSIASMNGTVRESALPGEVRTYTYTTETEDQRRDRVRRGYMNGITNFLAVVYYLLVVGIMYQMVGFAARERESGMSGLIEAMMPNARRWQPQAARLISYHLAFDCIYEPGWVMVAFGLGPGLFKKTNFAIVLIFFLLAGRATSSFAVFGASFFKKAQLSGISCTIISILLAIIAQAVSKSNSATVATLSFLFPPMNFVFFVISIARYERKGLGANIIKAAPESPWRLPGIVLLIFSVVHIFVYPLLGAIVERYLHGTRSKGRQISTQNDASDPVRLENFSKHYRPGWFSRIVSRKETVVAVDNLNMVARRGQIMALLGANGSGKTTTLDAIAGLGKVTRGMVVVDGASGLGICPQKNVLWNDLTVEEHIKVFNGLKAMGKRDTRQETWQLIQSCDLELKRNAKAGTLSGGQKRKLQLAMMFTGGSRVCCVDEVSSGLDPLSRRKIWDILLRERGARTIILTTHFLDEAEVLADHISILSRGRLKVEGSAVELKSRLGGGYRLHVSHGPGTPVDYAIGGLPRKTLVDETVYTIPTSAEAAQVIRHLEGQGVTDYHVSGPTIEDVFLQVAEEAKIDSDDLPNNDLNTPSTQTGEKGEQGLQVMPGRRIGMVQQAWVLFRKRVTILKSNPLPYYAAFFIPVIAAGIVTVLLRNFNLPGCAPGDSLELSDIESFISEAKVDFVVGPRARLSIGSFASVQDSLPGSRLGEMDLADLAESVHFVDNLDGFNDYIKQRYANVTPGGFYLGDANVPPTFAYKGNGGIYSAVLTQNVFNTLLTNVSISTQYAAFDYPWIDDFGKGFLIVFYLGLVMCAYPAFFALYPTIERIRNVRALHYSNGVRSFPLWLAYAAFDFCFVLVASSVVGIILIAATREWYHLGYLYCVLLLHGLASIMLSYVVSLFASSQLAAYAFAAAGQCIMFLLWFISYSLVYTYSPIKEIDSSLNVAHFVVSLFAPSPNLFKSLFVALNLFSTDCRDKRFISYPGEITLYGGPILYLLLQSLILFGVLLWYDNGKSTSFFRKSKKAKDEEAKDYQEKDISDELHRVTTSNDGLRTLHLTKAFKSNVAVQDVTFGVSRGEVFALLGPNGAGKSTTISMIRGDIKPSNPESEVYIENISIKKQRATARSHMGVCPQFDAMDQMTAIDHLRFYARVRGVPDIEHNVQEVIRAVGLESFSTRKAAKLSGGNKRKLSLGIALMGNPTVVLLDEPSSGMDAVAKRVMWKTLQQIVPDRSILLTTHSMEEAAALASRAGIMAKRMLALGTIDHLRQKHGDAYYVHIVTKTAPHTPTAEMDRIRTWILQNFPSADVEDRTYHGQMRFSVPTRLQQQPQQQDGLVPQSPAMAEDHIGQESAIVSQPPTTTTTTTTTTSGAPQGGISALFTLLEQNKDALGLEYYSVSRTTLDQVFLSIIQKHNVQEEDTSQKVGWVRRVCRKVPFMNRA